jgi:hypothetical protein
MPKKKGTKGGNTNPPRSPEVEAQVYTRDAKDPYPDVKLTKRYQIWLYEPIVEKLEQMTSTERALWLRGAITRAAIEDLGIEIK